MGEQTTVAPVTEFAVSKDGTRIAFERAGSGPLLVLVDGALCFRAFGPAREISAQLGALADPTGPVAPQPAVAAAGVPLAVP